MADVKDILGVSRAGGVKQEAKKVNCVLSMANCSYLAEEDSPGFPNSFTVLAPLLHSSPLPEKHKIGAIKHSYCCKLKEH